MFGIIFSIIAGLTMTLQGIFNTRLSSKIGLWETTLIVQGLAFVCTLIVFFFVRDGNFAELRSVKKLYLLGGILGVIITYTVMKGIGDLGPTYSIIVILISQLISAALIDAFALFDSTKVTFAWNNYLGIVLMLAGIIVFKFKS
ncbi:MAG: DMT family transporter [Sarcina sp.]